MQKTEKYKLNLIDPSDDFSPEPLNENTRTVEAQLAAHDQTLAGVKSDVVPGTQGKVARVVWGSTSSTNTLTMTFDFRPLVVLLCGNPSYSANALTAVLTRGNLRVDGRFEAIGSVVWTDKGFTATFTGSYLKDQTLYYAVIGEAL